MEYEGEEQDQGELVQRAPEALNIEDDLQDLDDDDIEDEAELEDEDVEAKKQPSPSATGGLDETVAAQGDDSQRKYDLRINVGFLSHPISSTGLRSSQPDANTFFPLDRSHLPQEHLRLQLRHEGKQVVHHHLSG